MSKTTAVRYLALFIVGGSLYALLEILWRSYTHWSMALTGGVCMVALFYINKHCKSVSVWSRALMGCAFITLAEFLVGLTVNVYFKWDVWNYSFIPLNFMGQICLAYTALWYFLCFPAFYLCEKLEKKVFLPLEAKFLNNG